MGIDYRILSSNTENGNILKSKVHHGGCFGLVGDNIQKSVKFYRGIEFMLSCEESQYSQRVITRSQRRNMDKFWNETIHQPLLRGHIRRSYAVDGTVKSVTIGPRVPYYYVVAAGWAYFTCTQTGKYFPQDWKFFREQGLNPQMSWFAAATMQAPTTRKDLSLEDKKLEIVNRDGHLAWSPRHLIGDNLQQFANRFRDVRESGFDYSDSSTNLIQTTIDNGLKPTYTGRDSYWGSKSTVTTKDLEWHHPFIHLGYKMDLLVKPSSRYGNWAFSTMRDLVNMLLIKQREIKW